MAVRNENKITAMIVITHLSLEIGSRDQFRNAWRNFA